MNNTITGGHDSCRERESGLYHVGHFKCVLSQELARLDHWKRPLSLALIEAPGMNRATWAALGLILRYSQRPIDLAARISADLAAVILPDADERQARRRLAEVMAEMEKQAFPATAAISYGLALARPWEGRTVDELLRMAADNLGRWPLKSIGNRGNFSYDSVTAIAADERNLLFAGFQELEAGLKH